MRRWKIITMLLLSIFVLGGLLAACSDDDSSNDADGSNDNESNNAGDTNQSNNEDEEVDKEIHFYTTSSKKPDSQRYVDALNEISGFNLDFEFVAPEEYEQKLPILFASGDLPDVIHTKSIDNKSHDGALENGILLELNDLLEEHGQNMLEAIPEEIWDHPDVSKDGKIYGLPILGAAPNTMVTYIRQDWLDKLDMEAPETLDEWLAYFEAVKQNDMNGDGDSDDEVGYFLRDAQGYNELFFGAFDVHPARWQMTDGEMTPDMITPEMKDAIAFYKDLYRDEYINEDMFTKAVQDWGNGILDGTAGSYTYLAQGFTTYGNPDEFDDSDAELELLPPAVGPDGHSGLGLESDGLNSVYVIPADTENPEEIIKYFDWAWSDEDAEKFYAFGIEGHNYTEENGEIDFDANAPVNADNFMRSLFAVYMNPKGDSQLSDLVLGVHPLGDSIQKGLDIASEHAMPDDGKNMPNLDAYAASPEIKPGAVEGTLFLEMFAKVVTGREELDTAFDKFVETWKKRGGDEAIIEATEWYNENN